MAKSRRTRRIVPDSYFELVAQFPLISSHSEADLNAAQAILDRLPTKGDLDAGDVLYLDALSDLIGAYEDVHHPIAPASDADMLRHLMDAKGIARAQLHRVVGIPRSTISEVLAGKRPFSKAMIRTLAEFFDVDASVLASNL